MSLGSDNKRSFVQRIPKTGKRERGKPQLVIFGGKTFDTPAVTKLFETCNMVYLKKKAVVNHV